MQNSIIQFENVVKTYGSGEGMLTAVDHVSFTVDRGEFTVILGQSGAGKSTVLNMLGGMDTPTSGKVLVDGEEISKLKDKRLTDYRARKVGFIFQFYNLLPGLTAKENIALIKEIAPDPLSSHDMLEAVGLADHIHQFPSELSGGEQQRVSIARALAKNPKILLCDEPTGALDSETGVMVLTLIHDICRKENKTVVLVTHNADIALCADRVIRMRNGKIAEISVNENPVPVSEVNW